MSDHEPVTENFCKLQHRNLNEQVQGLRQDFKELQNKVGELSDRVIVLKAKFAMVGAAGMALLDIILRIWKS